MAEDRHTWLAFFANELRHWRELRGMTQEQLAKVINYSSSTVAMIETACRKPKPDLIQRCDRELETGGALKRLYDELVSREVTPDWLDRWKKIEQQATAFNWFELFVMPGLIQTPGYARAVLEAGHPSSVDIDAQVKARLERQRILDGDDPPMFVGVMDESVLRRPLGGAKVMNDQLMHLAELSERPNIVLHIVPYEVGGYAGLTGPFVIALVDGDEVVYQDAALSGHVIEHSGDIATFKRMWEALRSDALPRGASLDLITKAARQWA
jgi:transcriptional regulator with XRE-family HTH domain